MKLQLLAGLAAGLLGVGGLVAAEQQNQPGAWSGQAWQEYPNQTWQDKIRHRSRFVLGGEYFYQRVHEKQPYSLTQDCCFFNDVGACDVEALSVLDSWTANGHGNFGAVFIGYQYLNCNEPYFALRGRWASGSLDQELIFKNDIARCSSCEQGDLFGGGIRGGNPAHEWNVEARVGYTWGLDCCCQWMLSPFLGAGYEAGRINLVGRQMYSWWYIPVGTVLTWQWTPAFSIALDGEFAMMAGAEYIQYDEPSVNNIHRHFDNKYRWELEMPLVYQFNCWGSGNFSLGLVPFWHGFRTQEKLQGQVPTAFSEHDETCLQDEGFRTFTGITSQNQPVATPRILANSWGGRLELGWSF